MLPPARKWIPAYSTMYFVSLALLVGSLPLSKFTTSFFQFSTLFFWLWHGVDSSFLKKFPLAGLKNPVTLIHFAGGAMKAGFLALMRKFLEFFRNKPAMAIASIIVLHVLGLLYTSDFNYALKDLRTKLPLLILPLFIATGPRITKKVFYIILACYIAAVLGGSIYRLILFLNLPIANSRALAAHTSHIRYSLNAVFAVFIIFFFVQSRKILSTWAKIVLLATAAWLIVFMLYMNYTTGLMLFAFISVLLVVLFIFRIRNIYLKVTALIGMSLIIILPVLYVSTVIYNYLNTPAVEFSKLDKYTPRGNSYYHDIVNFRIKNGSWSGLYICDKELRQSWAARSTFPLDSLDKNKQLMRFTLISYLASKNLRKDADGMRQLTDNDIRNIENGINRYDYYKLPGLRSQIEDFIAGYQRYTEVKDPNSGSMIQRFEYWRTSLLLIKQHPFLGVGTGDLPAAFQEQYRKMSTNLASQNRLRSHNQYLSITVALGFIGLAWFMFVMFYPGLVTRNFSNYFYFIFWIIFMLSMLTEDTIESQEGVTFYVLFTAIMLLGREKKENSELLFN